MSMHDPHGAGLGLRRELLPALGSGVPDAIDFLELAPENWMELGGAWRRDLRRLAAQRPVVAMGHEILLHLHEAGAVTGARRDPERRL